MESEKTKSKKKIIIIILFIIIGMLISVFIILKNLKEEEQKNEVLMKEIQNEYQQFETTLSTYNQNRETFSNYLSNYYQDNLPTEYSKYIALLKNQENTIKNLEKNINKIETNCKNRIFKQKEINDICSKYSEYYETVVNIYINDCKQFNTMIKAYNDTENPSLEEYHSEEINDYMDYNKDEKYLEKRD